MPNGIPAKRPSRCAWCGDTVEVGQSIAKRGGRWLHVECRRAAVATHRTVEDRRPRTGSAAQR